MGRNVTLFYLYRVVSRLYFHLPVLFLHLYAADMGVYRIIALLAVYGLVTTVTVNLSSWLLPYLRQKDVMACGEALKAVGLVLLIYGTRVAGTSFWVVMVGQIVGGCGFSLALSVDGGLLRTVTSGGGNELFNRTQSRTQSMMFGAVLVAGSMGSILFDYEAHWPFFASLGATVIAGTLIFLIHEEKAPAAPQRERKPVTLELDGEQKFWMNFYSLSRAFAMGSFVGFLPFYFIQLQVDPFLFGTILGLFTLLGFVSALYANAFLKRFGLSALMAATIASMLGSALLFGRGEACAANGLDYMAVGLIGIALLGAASGGIRPVAMANIDLGPLKPEQRAKLLGTMERNFGLCNGAILLAGAYLLVEHGFETLMLTMGACYVCAMGFLVATRLTGRRSAGPEAT